MSENTLFYSVGFLFHAEMLSDSVVCNLGSIYHLPLDVYIEILVGGRAAQYEWSHLAEVQR